MRTRVDQVDDAARPCSLSSEADVSFAVARPGAYVSKIPSAI